MGATQPAEAPELPAPAQWTPELRDPGGPTTSWRHFLLLVLFAASLLSPTLLHVGVSHGSAQGPLPYLQSLSGELWASVHGGHRGHSAQGPTNMV